MARCKTCGQPIGCAAVVETANGPSPCMDVCHSPAWQAAGKGHKIIYDETPSSRAVRIRELEGARPTLIAYLKMKLDAGDWHGCQDAASDLRDLDNELDGLRY